MLASVKSMTKRLAPTAGSRDRNSGAEVNVWARNPTDFRRPAIDARTSASSSMTNTVGDRASDLVMLCVAVRAYGAADAITLGDGIHPLRASSTPADSAGARLQLHPDLLIPSPDP